MENKATEHSSYRRALEASLRVVFRLEDVLPDGAELDRSLRFLPESLAQVESLTFLAPAERLALNQLRGHSYLRLFGVVEEFILPFVADHARRRFGYDDYETRALLQFAAEEAKHIHLFKRFAERFERAFGDHHQVIGPASGIAEAVLSHHPIGVGLMTLQIEWMTQRHYIESVKDATGVDPLIKRLLHHHWLEEAQHARLDTLIVEGLTAHSSRAEVSRGLADYARIASILAEGLSAQVKHDLAALEQTIERDLSADERRAVLMQQEHAYHYTFVETGVSHPRFAATYAQLAA
jgi:hypothetical protein